VSYAVKPIHWQQIYIGICNTQSTGRRNYGWNLKRVLDTWDRNGSTNYPSQWQICDYDDAGDDYYENLLCTNRLISWVFIFFHEMEMHHTKLGLWTPGGTTWYPKPCTQQPMHIPTTRHKKPFACVWHWYKYVSRRS
jgi:hypothetical protein